MNAPSRMRALADQWATEADQLAETVEDDTAGVFRQCARDLRAALDEQPAATTPVERQWAVIWHDPDREAVSDPPEVHTCEYDARRVHRQYPRATRLVSRTVTYGEWEAQS